MYLCCLSFPKFTHSFLHQIVSERPRGSMMVFALPSCWTGWPYGTRSTVEPYQRQAWVKVWLGQQATVCGGFPSGMRIMKRKRSEFLTAPARRDAQTAIQKCSLEGPGVSMSQTWGRSSYPRFPHFGGAGARETPLKVSFAGWPQSALLELHGKKGS